jgi:plasmid stability protein
MPDILIRNLDKQTTKRLKARAFANRRSLQAEVKEMIERSAHEKTFEELREELEAFSSRFKGRKMAGTVKLIREDRKR